MQVGDKVRLLYQPEVTAVITGIATDQRYTIQFDDQNLCPPVMDYEGQYLELISNDLPVGYEPKCECGRDAVGVGKHSDWCSLKHRNWSL